LVGNIPQRRGGWGTLPLPAWHPDVGWQRIDAPEAERSAAHALARAGESRVSATVPFKVMPHLVNPDAGFIATANNRPLPEGQGPFLGVDWVDGYRLTRIAEVLTSRRDWDLKAMQKLQMDQVSIPWRMMRPIVLSMSDDMNVPGDAEAHDLSRKALAMLAAWDGTVTADSPAATVFEMLVSEMLARMVKAKAPRSAGWVLGERFTPLLSNTFSLRYMGHLLRLMQDRPAGWFTQSWSEELADALTTVVKRLRARYGDDVHRWTWGRVRPLTLTHPVGARRPLLGRVFNVGPFPWGGDTYTVGQATVYPHEPLANPGAIASLRIVMDVADWERTEVVLPGGQSGNPLSPHYADMLPLWRRGEGVPLAWSPEAVARATTETLRLLPLEGA
jgi:penicillin amidase